MTARQKTADENPLAVIEGGVERSEDAPFVPSDYEFLPGDYLYFNFHIAGFKIKSSHTGEIKSLSLQYQITPQDLKGVALAEAVSGAITDDLQNEDKNWTPKRRANFLLPSFVATGEYRVHVVVKDLLADTEVVRDYPFRIGGTQVPATTSILAERFAFFRSAEDAKALDIPAYRPGDTVYARFLMVGFKAEADNKYRLSYGLRILRPDGKTFLNEPKAAQIEDRSFYPAQYMPGDIEVTTPRDAMHGSYELTLTVHDLISKQEFSRKEVFTIE